MPKRRPAELVARIAGMNHRSFQLPSSVLRTWCGRSKYGLYRIDDGTVDCLECICAPVPDRLRGYEPPFESWA